MSQNRSRFVLLCQQALACAVVVAAAAPAAGVVDLDIVAPPSSAPAPRAGGAATSGTATQGSLVASEPVEPVVTEVPITDARGLLVQRDTKADASQRLARTADAAGPDAGPPAALSLPERVRGFATVGVTWDRADHLTDDQITVSVRSLQDGEWSDWQAIPYDADHGPDPDSEEAQHARNGTDAVVVGDVDDVQVRAVTADGATLPDDMSLAIVDPGETVAPVRQQPAIDTARLASASVATDTTEPAPTDPVDPAPTDPVDPVDPGTDAELVGTPADVTPRPKIFSRAQWGADERMRDKSSLHYAEVHAGFVHHTVNANGYTKDEVPSILRGIYAYHTQSRGWSDIGYNFLVDRFGRIWEGRYGGVDRPVVGAHTLNYNDDAFAMSSIGNYETAQPSDALLRAYGRLFAWKLSLHGISASSKRQWVHDRWLPAINGHRDVGQTACPGKYLYAKIPLIREYAAADQRPFTSRGLDTDLAGSRWPDLVVREKGTNKSFVVRTGGQVGFAGATTAASGWSDTDLLAATQDVTGDGVPDMLARSATTKETGVYPGDGAGHFGAAVKTMTKFRNLDQLVAAGDLDGNGTNDVVGRRADNKALKLYPGKGDGGFGKGRLLAADWTYSATIGSGDLNGDGRADLVVRKDDSLLLVPGTGRVALGTPTALPRTWGGYDLVAGMGDVTNDGLPDLVARVAKTKLTFVYPGDGKGGLGMRFGPFGQFKDVDFLAGAGPVAGTTYNDLVGRAANGRMVLFANRGGTSIDGVGATGAGFGDTNLVLNVGDWNGDGYGDVLTRQASTGSMLLRAGDGNGGLDGPGRGLEGLELGRPGRRGRRHHRRRLPRPDGPALRRLDADLPGQRRHRLQGQLRRPQRDQLERPARGRAVERRRRARQPAPQGRRHAGGLRGQRPGRPDREREDGGVRHRGVRLDDRRGRRRRRRPLGRARPPADERPAVAAAGHVHGLRPAALRGRRLREVRPGGLAAELGGRALRVAPPGPRRRVGVAHPHGAAASCERRDQRRQAVRGARVHVGEQAAAGPEVRHRAPHQLRLGHLTVAVHPRDVVAGGRVVGHERVRLSEHHGAVVDDPRRQRGGEARPERPQRQGDHGHAVGLGGERVQAVRATDHQVGLGEQAPVVGDAQAQRPRGAEPDRAQPVRRQVDQHEPAALDVELVLDQPRGLGHPVRVGRHRELDPLARGVVVERHQRARGVGPELVGEDGGERLTCCGGGHGRTVRNGRMPPMATPGPTRQLEAVIVAGGFGTRLLPLTTHRPKHLLEVGGVPFLEHQVSRLAAAGVGHVVLATSYRADLFEPVLGDGSRWGIRLSYVQEDEPLGTGGAIRNVADVLGEDPEGAVVILNGDVLSGHDLAAQLQDFDTPRGGRPVDVSLHLVEVEDARPFGCVPTDDSGRVTAFVEKSEHPVTRQINAGCYVFRRRVVDTIPTGRAVSVERETFPGLVADDAVVVGYVENAYWRDVGTPAALVAASRDLVLGVATSPAADRAPGPAWVEPGADVAATATVDGGSTVAPGARVGEGARVSGSVLMEGATVGDGAEVVGCVLGPRSTVAAGVHLRDVTLGDGARVAGPLEPGSRVECGEDVPAVSASGR